MQDRHSNVLWIRFCVGWISAMGTSMTFWWSVLHLRNTLGTSASFYSVSQNTASPSTPASAFSVCHVSSEGHSAYGAGHPCLSTSHLAAPPARVHRPGELLSPFLAFVCSHHASPQPAADTPQGQVRPH